jgi:hypothetical protein
MIASTNIYLTKLKINKSFARTNDLFISQFCDVSEVVVIHKKNVARSGDKII